MMPVVQLELGLGAAESLMGRLLPAGTGIIVEGEIDPGSGVDGLQRTETILIMQEHRRLIVQPP